MTNSYLQYTHGIRSYYIERVLVETKQRAHIQAVYEYQLGAVLGFSLSVALYLIVLFTY